MSRLEEVSRKLDALKEEVEKLRRGETSLRLSTLRVEQFIDKALIRAVGSDGIEWILFEIYPSGFFKRVPSISPSSQFQINHKGQIVEEIF